MKKLIWGIIFGLIGIYLLLAYRNPFSAKSLIPNLEPYPDTLLYTLPAWNWAKGLGFQMGAGGINVRHSVPMTYSYYLALFMKAVGDVRGFYFGNIVLGLVTLTFFFLTLIELFGKEKYGIFVIGFLGFLLVTNFYFFNNPVLAMAENLVMPVLMAFFYFVIKKINIKNFIIMTGLVGLMAVIKSTSVIFAGLFGVILVTKFIWEVIWPKRKWRKYIVGVAIMAISAVLMIFLPRITKLSGTAYNISFFAKNWAFYWNCLSGGPTRNLWYYQKTLTTDVFVAAILGLVGGLADKKYRFFTGSIWLTIIVFVGAMSIFVDTEGRHVMVLVPLFIISGGIFLIKIPKNFTLAVLGGLLLLNLFLSYEPEGKLPKLISLKQQIGMNFRHAEVPWNYVCVEEFNQFFNKKDGNTYLGSFLPLYLFYFYGNNNYQTLPLSMGQDFMSRDMRHYYKMPLREEYLYWLKTGKNVYYSDYYSTNGREAWKNELAAITKDLKITKVFQSPEDVCNIYQLNLK